MNKTKTILILILITIQFSFSNTIKHPNIIIIITDDQGYGDLGINGNQHIKTPVLDKFAEQSNRFKNFYVSPVCAPTRSSLMTGRYSLRTGVRDTYNGGAIMASSEITIAEMLKQADYKTAIFGKWHLGDNYPSRPNDQGFDESVIHLSGGMGQVGDITTYFRGDSSYFNPVLWHNGKQKSYDGYCSDIFTNQAINFIEENQNNAFFCYLSYNAPHTPLQVPHKYYEMYKNIDPSAGFDNDKRPFPKMTENDKEDARKVYAMVTNIDENIGKLLNHLDELGISDNTVVIFMTDNGPQQNRYISGMRGKKGSVYRGGVRVPFYLRYSGIESNKDIITAAAHIDLLPTIAELCNVDLPIRTKVDGKSLVPLLFGNVEDDWQERSLFFYWTRRHPELYNNIALQRGDYRLIGNTSYDADITSFELYNIKLDPYEQVDLITSKKKLAENLKDELDKIYMELVLSENLINPPFIEIGNSREKTTVLNRNDAGGDRGIWAQEEIYGKWNVKINAGNYNIKFKFIKPVGKGGVMLLETGSIINRKVNLGEIADLVEMENVYLPEIKCELQPYYFINRRKILPFWIELKKLD